MKDKYESQSYNGWIVSDSFVKRSFAIWGHMLFAYAITALTLGTVLVLIAVAAGV